MADFHFCHPIEIRYGDLDPQGHVNNAKHLTYFGQEVKVGVRVAKLGTKSMTWEQNIVDISTGKELATGEIVLVTYNYKEDKTIPIPEEWRDKINQFESIEV